MAAFGRVECIKCTLAFPKGFWLRFLTAMPLRLENATGELLDMPKFSEFVVGLVELDPGNSSYLKRRQADGRRILGEGLSLLGP